MQFFRVFASALGGHFSFFGDICGHWPEMFARVTGVYRINLWDHLEAMMKAGKLNPKAELLAMQRRKMS
jgi:hypothetical protein